MVTLKPCAIKKKIINNLFDSHLNYNQKPTPIYFICYKWVIMVQKLTSYMCFED